jgi:hypothetical protein
MSSLIDLNHMHLTPEDGELLNQARAEVARDPSVRHDAPIFTDPSKVPPASPPFQHVHTDEEYASLVAAERAVHTAMAAIRADLVADAAACDADAAEMLARGDAHYLQHYGYAPGDGPTTLTEPNANDER